MIVFYFIFSTKRRKNKKQPKFPVEYIHNKRAINGFLEYEIYWFGHATPTWEPQNIIQIDIPEMMYVFERNMLDLLQLLKDYACGAQDQLLDAKNQARDAQNEVRNMVEETARQIAIMHQRCRELEADCRSKDDQLRRVMGNRNECGRFECYLCHVQYNRKDRFYAHMRQKHVFGNKIAAICATCKKPFCNEFSLRRHITTKHTKLKF